MFKKVPARQHEPSMKEEQINPTPEAESTPSGCDASGAKICPLRRWGRRLGIASFCFFLFKGLLWLVIPAWIVIERGCAG